MQAIVVLVTVKIFVSTSSHTYWSVFFQIGSVTCFYIWIILSNFVPISLSELLGVGSTLLPFISNYLLLFITVIAYILIDVGMWHLDQQVSMIYDIMEENKECQQKTIRMVQSMERKRKLTTYRHRGYAFDGAAGHDVLVTDGLINRIKYAFNTHLNARHTPFAMNKWVSESSMNKLSSEVSFRSKNQREVSEVSEKD